MSTTPSTVRFLADVENRLARRLAEIERDVRNLRRRELRVERDHLRRKLREIRAAFDVARSIVDGRAEPFHLRRELRELRAIIAAPLGSDDRNGRADAERNEREEAEFDVESIRLGLLVAEQSTRPGAGPLRERIRRTTA